MSDTFLPGSGFDTYESQDKVLVQMDGSRECAVAVRILQQQGFAVAGGLDAGLAAGGVAARKAAEALGIECIVLNAEALAGQDADVLGDGGTPLFAALLTAADKLGMQYVATAHRARVETGADGVHTVCPPAGTGSDDSTILAEFFFYRQGRCDTRHLLFLLPAETAARRQKCILRFGPHSRENENREHPQMFPIFALSI